MLRQMAHQVQAIPQLGVNQRVAILAASAAWQPPPRGGGFAREQVDRALLRLAQPAMVAVAQTSPHVAVGRVADAVVGVGPQDEPQDRQAWRYVVLAGDAVLVVAGVLIQRAVITRGGADQAAQLAVAFGRQLAIGGVAGLLVVGTDAMVGRRGRDQLARKPVAASLGGFVAMAQSAALRRASHAVSLPLPVRPPVAALTALPS